MSSKSEKHIDCIFDEEKEFLRVEKVEFTGLTLIGVGMKVGNFFLLLISITKSH